MGHEQIKTSSEKSGLWFTEDFILTEHAALTLDHIQGWAPNAGATRHPRTWSSSTCVMGLAAQWVLSIACWTAITLVSFQLVLKWLCLKPEDPACLPPTVIWLGLLLSKHLGQLSLSLSGSAFLNSAPSLAIVQPFSHLGEGYWKIWELMLAPKIGKWEFTAASSHIGKRDHDDLDSVAASTTDVICKSIIW